MTEETDTTALEEIMVGVEIVHIGGRQVHFITGIGQAPIMGVLEARSMTDTTVQFMKGTEALTVADIAGTTYFKNVVMF